MPDDRIDTPLIVFEYSTSQGRWKYDPDTDRIEEVGPDAELEREWEKRLGAGFGSWFAAAPDPDDRREFARAWLDQSLAELPLDADFSVTVTRNLPMSPALQRQEDYRASRERIQMGGRTP